MTPSPTPITTERSRQSTAAPWLSTGSRSSSPCANRPTALSWKLQPKLLASRHTYTGSPLTSPMTLQFGWRSVRSTLSPVEGCGAHAQRGHQHRSLLRRYSYGRDAAALRRDEPFREALPLLQRTPDPMLVFMSSFADVTAGPATSAHSGAWAALERFARHCDAHKF